MRITTWNVNSVRARLPRLGPWLAEKQPDVVCLQELKCTDDDFPRADVEALGYRAEVFGQKTYNGVAILARSPITDVVRWRPKDATEGESRVISAVVGGMRIASVYVVNGQEVGSAKYAYKLEWLDHLRSWLAATHVRDEPVVIGGDFNITFDDRDVYDPAAWREQILCSTPEREALRALIELGLVDVFRRFHDDGGHYTWWDFRTRGFQRGQGLRIDHFLVNAKAAERARAIEIDLIARGGEKPSDHAPLTLTLDDGSGSTTEKR